MGPIWVLSAPDGPHVGPMNLAIGDGQHVVWSDELPGSWAPFCRLFGVCSGCVQPITGQVTSVTWPVIA